jgi:predicted AlkP superfamily pyrophosphatase or phosphodiesterase
MGNKKRVADSSWYGGTPLWVLAEKQKMLSASFYWVASESAIQGTRPSYYYIYNEKISMDERLQAVKDWLSLPEKQRPHLITFYIPNVDHVEHLYGPESPETAAAVAFVDSTIGKMVNMVDSLHLPVNFIFVSDHGMTTVDNSKAISLPAAIDTSKIYVPFGDALLHLYAKDTSAIRPTYKALKKDAKDYDVYLAANVPARWHYSKKDDRYNRIGDMILVPHLPGFFNIGGKPNKTIGKHGFDPALTDMHAVFYAWGPAFKKHAKTASFENIHIYPLIAKILKLSYSPSKIDGNIKVLAPILK